MMTNEEEQPGKDMMTNEERQPGNSGEAETCAESASQRESPLQDGSICFKVIDYGHSQIAIK